MDKGQQGFFRIVFRWSAMWALWMTLGRSRRPASPVSWVSLPTMTDRLRVAILGAGMIGDVHRRAAMLAGAEVVGVMASSPARSEQVASDWGLESSYPAIEAVAAADLDLVHVC